jgi:hypothetical protein
MPPDDPASHQLMHCVDCKAGWPCWHRSGDTPHVENPNFPAYLPYDEEGYVVLDLESAYRVATVNSRGYQSQFEELYLSALDVTFERFRFDTQFFAGNQTFFTTQGRVRGGGESRSILTTATDLEARKLLTTGGELVVGFANTFMWQFAGPNTETVNSLLDFSLIQPLLRFGGRELVMERLTIAERTLLGNLRAMQTSRLPAGEMLAADPIAAAVSSAAPAWKASPAWAAAVSAPSAPAPGAAAARLPEEPEALAPARPAATWGSCRPSETLKTNGPTWNRCARRCCNWKPCTRPIASIACRSTWPARRCSTAKASC